MRERDKKRKRERKRQKKKKRDISILSHLIRFCRKLQGMGQGHEGREKEKKRER